MGSLLDKVWIISLAHNYLLLQTQNFRVSQEKELCIRVNTRELNRELCTGLFTLYTNI